MGLSKKKKKKPNPVKEEEKKKEEERKNCSKEFMGSVKWTQKKKRKKKEKKKERKKERTVQCRPEKKEKKKSAALDQIKRKEERKMKMSLEKKADEEASKASSRVLHWQWVHACGCNYKNVIENRVMETENTSNVFSVFITHYSKIRESSDRNKNWKQSYENPNRLLSYESHYF